MRLWKLLLLLLSSSLCLAAQADRIPGPIDSSQMVALSGNVHRKALPQYDRGPVQSALPFSYVTLVIAPSPSQQMALDQLLAQQQDRSSPYFHKWLTPEQYADRFGLSENDVSKITSWLKSQGFTVLAVARGRNSITFSGTAAQIQEAFNTEIHRYEVNGEKHIANSTPVQIPAALSGVVTVVHGLTDFRPKPMYVRAARGDKSGPHPGYTTTISGKTDYFMAPGDIATLYDINPLYNAATPIDGTGQKLAIVGQTDVYLADLVNFRSGFNLPSFTCATGPTGLVTSCDTPNFRYVLVGADQPVSVGDLIEADLDLEWSGAIAQNAQIIFVNAPISPSETSGGVNDALAFAIDNNLAPVISMSYGLCEAENGSLETELQQGNTEGITILNSSGDSGSFACDDNPPGTTSTFSPNPPFAAALGGLAVNYPASSPEVTGVGGTSIPAADFTSAFWGPSNGTNGGSALTALIGQELSWNDDEAFAQFCQANSINMFCENGGPPAVTGWVPLTSTATAAQVQGDIWISIGSGGVSNCINSTGICTGGFPRPAWQQAITIPGLASPQSTFRFLPDLSLSASPNFPGYIICTPQEEVVADSGSTTSTCSPGGTAGISTAVDTFLSLVGGTSASTPVFAGIVTLLNQSLGSSGLGNINPTLYALAQSPSNGAFHPVKSGDNNVYCQIGTPVGQPSYVICPAAGVAGFSAASADTTTGYNLVTGLGSVDANALATAWAASRTASSITLSTPATNVFAGAPVTFTVAVTPSTGVGAVKFSTLNGGSTTVLGTATLASGTATLTTTELPSGSNSVTATYGGDASHSGSTSSSAVVTVTTPFTMSALPTSLRVSAGQTASTTITITPAGSFIQPVTFTNSTVSSPGSCTAGLPAGALCNFSQGSVTLNGASPSTVVLTISTAANMVLPLGPQTVTITGVSGSAAISTTVSLTISKTTESFTLSSTAATFPVSVGGTAKIQVNVNSTTGFINSSNSTTALPLTYTCSGIPIAAEISCQVSSNGQPTTASSVTVNLVTTPVTTELLRPPLGRSRIFYALLLPGLFGVVFIRPRMRASRLLGLIVVLGLCTLGLGSCGGNNNSNSGLKNAGTPPGSYAVTINATTGAPTGGTALVNSNAPFTITLAVSP
jgi:hypothetical protein